MVRDIERQVEENIETETKTLARRITEHVRSEFRSNFTQFLFLSPFYILLIITCESGIEEKRSQLFTQYNKISSEEFERNSKIWIVHSQKWRNPQDRFRVQSLEQARGYVSLLR